MTLRIDPNAAHPPYDQLREQLMHQIRQGQLTAGATLPPVRRLASDLGLAPNTVARAYRELEAAGVAQGQGRRGTVVLDGAKIPDGAASATAGASAQPGTMRTSEQAAEQLTRDYLASMAALGHSDDDALAWVHHLRRS